MNLNNQSDQVHGLNPLNTACSSTCSQKRFYRFQLFSFLGEGGGGSGRGVLSGAVHGCGGDVRDVPRDVFREVWRHHLQSEVLPRDGRPPGASLPELMTNGPQRIHPRSGFDACLDFWGLIDSI